MKPVRQNEFIKRLQERFLDRDAESLQPRHISSLFLLFMRVYDKSLFFATPFVYRENATRNVFGLLAAIDAGTF
jgi:hypothetical protein